MKRCFSFAALLVCLLSTGAGDAHAGSDEKRAARAQMERIQRMQQAQQALEAEKGQLTAEKIDLEGKLKAVAEDVNKAKAAGIRQGAAMRRELQGLRAEKDALSEQIAAAQVAKAEQEKLIEALKQQLQLSQSELSQTRIKLSSTEGALSQRVKALSTCEGNNQSLYKLNTSLLEQYEKRSCSSEWLKGGVFTQLERVKVENDHDTYMDKFDSLRVTPMSKP